jgi:hypothetical protein
VLAARNSIRLLADALTSDAGVGSIPMAPLRSSRGRADTPVAAAEPKGLDVATSPRS